MQMKRKVVAPRSTSPPSIQFLAVAFLCYVVCCCFTPTLADKDDDDIWSKFKINRNKESFSSEENDDREIMETIVSWIIGIVVFIAVALFVCILCLCCPICILAKMRGRRRGVVYRSAVASNGTTVTTSQGRGGTTITVSRQAQAQTVTPLHTSPPANANVSVGTTNSVIAIRNGAQNKPYPVQESVTVVPVVNAYSQSQPTHVNYATPYTHPQPHQSYQLPQQYPSPADPPPPYPGLTRDIDTNLPYNPYFQHDTPQASAPPAKE